MREPIFRWVCTYCAASGTAENSEMARLAVEVHMSMFHSPAHESEGGGGPDPDPESSRTGG